jgi:Tfp pilus assembly protein PilN
MVISGFNLAEADYRRSRRELAMAAGVAGLLALLLVGQFALWISIRREGRSTGERLAQMEQEFRRHEDAVRGIRGGIPDDAIQRYEKQVGVFNQILEASAFSWTTLLAELERSVPPTVSLSEIHPELATGKVMLRGKARSFEDLSLLLRGLEERTMFRDVYLLRQTDRRALPGGPNGLEFAVSLMYQGRGR